MTSTSTRPTQDAQGADPWMLQYESVKRSADQILAAIQDRRELMRQGAQVSRQTAAIRRKLGAFGASLDDLFEQIHTTDGISAQELHRRRDMVSVLRARAAQLGSVLGHGGRNAKAELLKGETSAGASHAGETEDTAALDAQGILQLQQQVIERQDDDLQHLHDNVQRTKEVALTINEELGLQNRLLSDLDDEVDVTHSRMRAAKRKVREILRRSKQPKSMCLMLGLIALLVFLVVLVLK
ncbi:unnamed protein product [Pedinophyceae sp. YPF-701]|nr:unnamed protein product [Pedinophyceae sp. YPF-701]